MDAPTIQSHSRYIYWKWTVPKLKNEFEFVDDTIPIPSNQQQEEFNEAHKKTRVAFERSFGELKSRFRYMLYLHVYIINELMIVTNIKHHSYVGID